MRVISVSDFEGMMKRIKSIVGANADAIGKMQGALAEVSQQYPVLSAQLTELANRQGQVSAAEKAALQTKVRNLYFIGKINDAQYKQLSSYLSANKQMSSEDKKRQQQMQAQIADWNSLKRHMEDIGMVVGKTIMPVMQRVANLLESWKSGNLYRSK